MGKYERTVSDPIPISSNPSSGIKKSTRTSQQALGTQEI